MKLELKQKHLAPYLPYGLKMNYGIHNPELIGMEDKYTIILVYEDGGIKQQDINSYKPILYSLDWLTKEIEHNGEKFVPMDVMADLFGEGYLEFDIHDVLNQPYKQIEKLLEWKFDVFNLIPNNLAIAVTENFNPYK